MIDETKHVDEKKSGKVICEADLENVSGGYVFDESKYCPWVEKPYQVIDDSNGKKVLGRYNTMQEAKKMADEKSQTTSELTASELNEYKAIRGRKQIKRKR